MQKPDQNILDTLIKIEKFKFGDVGDKMRNDIIPWIRAQQKQNFLKWFCFLIHDRLQLSDRLEANDNNPYFHLRLCPGESISTTVLTQLLPANFIKTKTATLGKIAGINQELLKNNDWLNAWHVIGETSDLILKIVESYDPNVSIDLPQFLQFLHYATNSITLGGRFILLPGPVYRI